MNYDREMMWRVKHVGGVKSFAVGGNVPWVETFLFCSTFCCTINFVTDGIEDAGPLRFGRADSRGAAN